MSKSEAASDRRENVLETGREHFARSAPVQAFERTVVEHVVDPLELLVGQVIEGAAFRKDFAHDAVTVFVGTAFP